MNKALSSHKDSDFYFPMRKADYNLLKKKLVEAGKSEGHFNVLEPECAPGQLKVLEERKAKWVLYYIRALSAGADIDTLPDIRSCEDLDTESVDLAS